MKRTQEIWVIGAGRFGKAAGLKLKQKFPDHRIVGVDKDPGRCENAAPVFDQVFCMEGILFLTRNLKAPHLPSWVVPVIPVHLAFQWVRQELISEVSTVPVALPRSFVDVMPNPIAGAGHDIYVSIADFLCPDNCPAPERFCTHTRKPRPYNLFEKIVKECPEGFLPVVLESQQLVPGTGGILSNALLDALETVRTASQPVLMATACRCHGVITAFCLKKQVSD